MMNAAVDSDQIVEVLKSNPSRFLNKYLIAVAPDEDLSDLDWDSGDHLSRKTIIQQSHLLLASNPNTISWGLGQKNTSPQEFITEFGSLKPSVWGSDAHSFDKMFKPDQNRNCWIKADLTFEGLRQLVFEPKERVRIQDDSPNESYPYQIIDCVRFIPQTTSGTFQPDYINFNPGLNCIIGGKSSGKSLLLHHIAKTINPEVVEKTTDGEGYRFNEEVKFDFEVKWKDGRLDKLSEGATEEKTARPITFIPQLFVNRLVETNNNQTFKNLILGILNQNSDFKERYSAFLKTKETLERQIESSVREIVSLVNQRNRQNIILKELGDLKAIEAQIKKIEQEITSLTSSSNLKPEEIASFNTHTKQSESLTLQINQLDIHIEKLNTFKIYIDKEFGLELHALLLEKAESLHTEEDSEEVLSTLRGVADEVFKKLAQPIAEAPTDCFKKIEELTSDRDNKKRQLKSISEKITPLLKKVQNQEKLKKLQDSLSQQQKVKEEHSKIHQKINSIVGQIREKYENVWSLRNEINLSYEELIRQISELGLDAISDDIKLNIRKRFDLEKFNEIFSVIIDMRSIKSNLSENYDEAIGIKTEGDNQFIKSVFAKVMKEDLKIRSGNELVDALTRLTRDYFTLDFNLIHKNDDISRMSPGKRGLVVLQLILHLSNSKDPILIDQPEDNLDNRTIYEELNSFILEKKKVRQIIIVTHNPNLVVSTDAENSIVANQSGQVEGKENRQYQFEYINGSLENSFNSPGQNGVLFQKGIRQHICEVLEGGEEAFKTRQRKYSFKH